MTLALLFDGSLQQGNISTATSLVCHVSGERLIGRPVGQNRTRCPFVGVPETGKRRSGFFSGVAFLTHHDVSLEVWPARPGPCGHACGLPVRLRRFRSSGVEASTRLCFTQVKWWLT